MRFDRINGIFRINRILKGERACGPASFLGWCGLLGVYFRGCLGGGFPVDGHDAFPISWFFGACGGVAGCS